MKFKVYQLQNSKIKFKSQQLQTHIGK